MEEKTFKQRLEELEEKISSSSEEERKKKEKKFKVPFGKKVGAAQKKKNFITVWKINENGHTDIKKLMIDDQTIMMDGIPRLATSQYIMYYKKNPMIIIPSWSVEPISPKKMLDQSLKDGSNTKGYKILMDKMQKEQIGAKKPMGALLKWIIGGILLAVVGYAFISGGI